MITATVKPTTLANASTMTRNDIIDKLSEIVEESCIEDWLQTPNKSFDNKRPNDLIEEEDFEPILNMIYQLGSGEPSS